MAGRSARAGELTAAVAQVSVRAKSKCKLIIVMLTAVVAGEAVEEGARWSLEALGQGFGR